MDFSVSVDLTDCNDYNSPDVISPNIRKNIRVVFTPSVYKHVSTSPVQKKPGSPNDKCTVDAHDRLFINLCQSKRIEDPSLNVFLIKSRKRPIKVSAIPEVKYNHVYKEDKNIENATSYYKNKLSFNTPVLLSQTIPQETIGKLNRQDLKKSRKLNTGQKVKNITNGIHLKILKKTDKKPSFEVKLKKRELIPQTKAKLNCGKLRCASVSFSDTFRNFKLKPTNF